MPDALLRHVALFHLLDQNISSVLIVVVVGLVEVFVESSSVWTFHVVAMRVYPQVCRRLTLSYVLGVIADVAETQIYDVPATAVEFVFDRESFVRDMASECLCRDDLLATLVVCSG